MKEMTSFLRLKVHLEEQCFSSVFLFVCLFVCLFVLGKLVRFLNSNPNKMYEEKIRERENLLTLSNRSAVFTSLAKSE